MNTVRLRHVVESVARTARTADNRTGRFCRDGLWCAHIGSASMPAPNTHSPTSRNATSVKSAFFSIVHRLSTAESALGREGDERAFCQALQGELSGMRPRAKDGAVRTRRRALRRCHGTANTLAPLHKRALHPCRAPRCRSMLRSRVGFNPRPASAAGTSSPAGGAGRPGPGLPP